MNSSLYMAAVNSNEQETGMRSKAHKAQYQEQCVVKQKKSGHQHAALHGFANSDDSSYDSTLQASPVDG